MRETKFAAIRSPLQADLDRIAEDVVAGLGVDMALFSVTHNQTLVSLGISQSVARSKEGRVHNLTDLICRQTIQRNAPVMITDARNDPTTKEIPLVRQGAAVSYLGVPVQNAEIGVIGAICGVSSTPRSWSEADLRYLTAISLTVENLVLREMYRLESTNASDLAAEYDQIISAFSIVRADPTSIHDQEGSLVFANRALTEYVGDRELQCPKLTKSLLAISEKGSNLLRVESGAEFRVSRQRTSSGYLVFHWKYERSLFH
ncbi:MAG: GAF domain-containing protein [Pseudomonadota bacterium]